MAPWKGEGSSFELYIRSAGGGVEENGEKHNHTTASSEITRHKVRDHGLDLRYLLRTHFRRGIFTPRVFTCIPWNLLLHLVVRETLMPILSGTDDPWRKNSG